MVASTSVPVLTVTAFDLSCMVTASKALSKQLHRLVRGGLAKLQRDKWIFCLTAANGAA